MLSDKKLIKKANQIRHDVIEVAVRNKAGHIAPSLSTVDILVALYYRAMSYRPRDPLWEHRDRLIFSKGHGCYALYAILADLGTMPKKEWKNFYRSGSTLMGCVERCPKYGLEAACGSLGHGLPIAVGVAAGAKLQGKRYHVFCIMGDGEMQEGSTWEALQFAVKHKLSNLTLIIDSNRLQAMDFIINILDHREEDMLRRLKGFGLSPVSCPGHDVVQLVRSILNFKKSSQKSPRVIVANTIKGFGLKCMENVPNFHFCVPTEEDLLMGRSYERKP
jgi:transketolase